MEYLAIERDDINKLTLEVNRLIADGWEPFGGLSTSLSESDDYFYCTIAQAMVRRGEGE